MVPLSHKNDDVCDTNANCTNTNGSHNCICKEGYIITGQSCQRRLEQRYLMLSKADFHNKYRLRNCGHDQEATWWFSRPDLVFLSSYGFHHMHTCTFFDGLKYNTCGYFTSCLVFFYESGGKNIRPRSDNHPPPPPFSSLTFLNSIDTRKILKNVFAVTFFDNFSTFNNSTISTAK